MCRTKLNTRGTFSEFVSNIMITDDAIRAHKETKKRKVVATPSGSASPKYRMVYHHGSTYPPRPQHQQQCPQQQWASYPSQR
jgi:transglutaminase/protease-like cytokinesis protein 3